MSRVHLLTIWIAPLLAAGCASMQRGGGRDADALDEPQPVALVGAQRVSAMGWMGGLLYVEADGARAPLVRVGDGEPLQVRFDSTQPDHPLIYRRQDGPRPAVAWNDPVLSLNGQPSTLVLAGATGWGFLARVDAATLAALRLVEFPEDAGSLAPQQAALLDKLAAANPRIGLWLRKGADRSAILARFHPRYLSLGEGGAALAGARRESLDQVETLEIDVRAATDLGFLASLPALRRLWLANAADDSVLRTLPVPHLRRLRQLIIGGDVKGPLDLASLRGLDGLQDLQLLAGEGLRHPDALAALPRLSSLLLLVGEPKDDASTPFDLGMIRGGNLRHFGGVADGKLAALVAAMPRLEALDLFDKNSEGPGDLAPLRTLPHLTALSLCDLKPDEAQLATLASLSSLRYLVIHHEVFGTAGAPIAALRKALPECAVVPGGVCLGSGFILLLPVLVMFGALAHRRRREGAPRAA